MAHKYDEGGSGKVQVNEENIIRVWDLLDYTQRQMYWGLYQEALKNQFEKNKDENLAKGDYSYFEQKINSGQLADQQRYNNLNDRVNVISTTSSSSNAAALMLVGAVILFVISLFKK